MPDTLPFAITAPMSAERGRQIATSLDLRPLPADFYANPYAVYDLLRKTETLAWRAGSGGRQNAFTATGCEAPGIRLA